MSLHRATSLRSRQIHLDFHTSPTIEGIGSQFDRAEFAATMRAAHVNSVTVFGRCHHGMAYYPSKVAPVHPGLDFDLLGGQIEALHSAGIRAPIYLTVTWDQYIGEKHPDWLQRKPDGGTYGEMPERASWHWVSSAVPEYADYLEAQVDELFDLYGKEVDGFFWDIVMTGGEGDCHPLAIESRICRGLPDTVAGRKRSDHMTHRALMTRLSDRIAAQKPDATVFYNSRFGLEFREEETSYSHVEIEALPTGGWGYGYFPLWARYGRNFGFPFLGMTGRFHTHWGDFGALKEASALRFECGGIIANGGACSIGDQLHPSGRLDPAVYDCIGEAYAEVEALEPWTDGSKPVTEIALLLHTKSDPAQAGAAKMLLEEHWQFDAIDAQADFSRYRAIVVPDGFPSSEALLEKLRAFVSEGGAVVLGQGALSLGDLDAAEVMGVSEIAPTFFRAADSASQGLRSFDYVVYGHADDLSLLAGAEPLAARHDALFNREPHRFISHMHAPAQDDSAGPAIARRGQVIRLGQPLFTQYQKVGTVAYRRLVQNCLRLLVPTRVLETTAPTTAEVTVTRSSDHRVIHVVNYSPMRRGDHMEIWEDPTPLHDVRITIPAEWVREGVHLLPADEPLSLQIESADLVSFRIPRVECHAAVVVR